MTSLAAAAEFENQGAYQLAHTFDPDGKRTIGPSALYCLLAEHYLIFWLGVLTKPDRVGRGDEQKWITVLKNEHKGLELDNGWFSVKQPDTVQLEEGITRAEARQAEEKYFESTSHWASLPLKFRQRLGTDNLAERCSELLSALVIKQYVIQLYRLVVRPAEGVKTSCDPEEGSGIVESNRGRAPRATE